MNKENGQWSLEVIEKNYRNVYLDFWVTFPESSHVSYASFDKNELISTPGYHPENILSYRILISKHVCNNPISFYSQTGVIPFLLSFSEDGEPSIKTMVVDGRYDRICVLDFEPGMIWLDGLNVYWITGKTIQENLIKDNVEKFESAKNSAELAGFTDHEIDQILKYHPKFVTSMLYAAARIVHEYQIEKSKIISALIIVGNENVFVIQNYILINHFSSSICRSNVLNSIKKGKSLDNIKEIIPEVSFVGDIGDVVKSLTLAIQKGVNFSATESVVEENSTSSVEKFHKQKNLAHKKEKKVKISERPETFGDVFNEKLSALRARFED